MKIELKNLDFKKDVILPENISEINKCIENNPDTLYFTGVIGVNNYKKFWEISSKWKDKKAEKPH